MGTSRRRFAMRTGTATLCLFALAATACGGCGGGTVNGHPDIDVSPTALDFGTVATGASVTRSLVVKDTSTASLTISKLVVTPQSVAADFYLALQADILKGGAKAILSITFDAPSTPGYVTATLAIASDAENAPEVSVELTARVVPACTVASCGANARCDDSSGPATCTCDEGYSGDGKTCTAIDSCATNNGGCDPHATCTSTGPGTDSCACNDGYSGDGQSCAAVDTCATNNGGCDPHATCTSTGPGTSSCSCNDGYAGDGHSCTAVDSCATNNGGCDPHATCVSTGPGTSSCSCDNGYAGSGQTCTPIDSCATNDGGCSSHAACTSTGPGTNACTCVSGYTGNGIQCTPIDSCATNNGGCDPHATCTSTGPGTNACTCDTGYTGNGLQCTAIDPYCDATFPHRLWPVSADVSSCASSNGKVWPATGSGSAIWLFWGCGSVRGFRVTPGTQVEVSTWGDGCSRPGNTLWHIYYELQENGSTKLTVGPYDQRCASDGTSNYSNTTDYTPVSSDLEMTALTDPQGEGFYFAVCSK